MDAMAVWGNVDWLFFNTVDDVKLKAEALRGNVGGYFQIGFVGQIACLLPVLWILLIVEAEFSFGVFGEDEPFTAGRCRKGVVDQHTVQQIVLEEMEKACPMQVPLKADCGWGKNWLEAHW